MYKRQAEVRRSQYSWFINFVIDEPLKFLFGSGFGNSININNTEVVALELDHIDTIRKYGFFWFMIVFAPSFIICIINLFKSRNAGVVVAYIFTFVAVGTNPLLLTSVFFILSFVVFRIISSFNLNE